MLTHLFKSVARTEILRLLFTEDQDSFYLRQLERETVVKKTALDAELKNLTEHGYVHARRDGNRVYYSANTHHPLYPELVSMVAKSFGEAAILKQLVHSDDRIHLAVLFGSLAKGTAKAESDVDLIIVGKLGLRAFVKLLRILDDGLIQREINPNVYSPNEFAAKLAAKDHFLTAVLAEPYVLLKGELSEFR